jgi:hypothetical protein
LKLLLGKSIDAHTILMIAIAEWRKNSPYTRNQTEELYKKIRATVSAVDSKTQTHQEQISGYNAICTICSPSKNRNYVPIMKGKSTSD